jgi:hypothetical protein
MKNKAIISIDDLNQVFNSKTLNEIFLTHIYLT